MIHVHQINLQKSAGGGEVYTRWFTRALFDAGARVTLYVDPSNAFWHGLESDRIRIVGATRTEQIAGQLPKSGALIITQSRIPDALTELVARDHVLTGFAHMPMFGRSAIEFTPYAMVYTVSEYCVGLLRKAGIAQTYLMPLYGTGEQEEARFSSSDRILRARSPYHWDTRKVRDKVFSMLEPLARAFGSPDVFERMQGLTLGVVSLISPIKQFPELFTILSPRIAHFPEVRLEIFGDGGYAQVRDLRRALAPIAARVRFWGYQKAVQAIYPQLDYLMTGLPEKEALGLNVLEAQMCGTPVLAPRAPPFTETVLDGQSGFLYCDPREDQGQQFGELLASLVAGRARPDPRLATLHLAKFSYAAMVERTKDLLAHAERNFPQIAHTGTAGE